jgi:LDH2 family malate/lactate/ureidoglycolate dehydrogenase
LLPFGGYKGFGLALMMQALGLLAGSDSDAESEYGYLFVAFRPDLIGSAAKATKIPQRSRLFATLSSCGE